MKNKYRKLEQLYKQIPNINCKGLCHDSCSLIPASRIEIKRAKERLKKNPFIPELDQVEEMLKGRCKVTCKALKDKHCTIYSIRPAICRLYGVAEGLSCEFGCLPENVLPKNDAYELIRKIEEL